MAKEHRVRGAVERFASRVGKTQSQLLSASDYAVAHPEYPKTECLYPDDIVAYEATGILPHELQVHATTCPFCGDLLTAIVPEAERLQAFRSQVEQARAAAVVELTTIPSTGGATTRLKVLMASASLFLIAAAIAGYAFYPKEEQLVISLPPIDAAHGPRTVISSKPTSASAGTPVRIVYQARRPTTLVVRDSYVPVAASVAAVSKAQLDFSGAAVGQPEKQEAQEKAVYLIADILEKSSELEKSSQGQWDLNNPNWLKNEVTTYWIGQPNGVKFDEKSGAISMRFTSQAGDFSADFNLLSCLKDARMYQPTFERHLNEAALLGKNPYKVNSKTIQVGGMTVSFGPEKHE